jgi:hypothetical protein
MNMKELEPYFIDTGQKKLKYRIMKCKTCVWASNHDEEQNIIVDEAKANTLIDKRVLQMNNHLKNCPFKHFLSHIPGISSPTISLVGTSTWCVEPSDSSSNVIGVKRKRQKIIQPSFLKDSPIDQVQFERNVVNVIAATGIPFGFFENYYVKKLLTDMRPLIARILPSGKVVSHWVSQRAQVEKEVSFVSIKREIAKGNVNVCFQPWSIWMVRTGNQRRLGGILASNAWVISRFNTICNILALRYRLKCNMWIVSTDIRSADIRSQDDQVVQIVDASVQDDAFDELGEINSALDLFDFLVEEEVEGAEGADSGSILEEEVIAIALRTSLKSSISVTLILVLYTEYSTLRNRLGILFFVEEKRS